MQRSRKSGSTSELRIGALRIGVTGSSNLERLRNEKLKRDMQVLKMEKEVAIKQNARLNSQLIRKNKRIQSLKRTLKDERASKFTFYLLVITLILILQISSQSV